MLLVKHRFHHAAQTGFELSLRYQPLKGLELEVHTSVPKCYHQKIQRKKKKNQKNLHEESFPQLLPQVSLRVEKEIRPHERLSSPLNLSSLVELQISQKKIRKEPAYGAREGQPRIQFSPNRKVLQRLRS